MDNTVNNKRDILKERMDSLFTFASKVPYESNHLLPIIQAGKSLIGMNIDSPPRSLLKWLEGYIQNFQPTYIVPESLSTDKGDEVFTVYHLEDLIRGNKVEESRSYLINILQLADPRHIMELFLEISLRYAVSSTLFCWAAYKSIKNMNIEDSRGLLFIALDCLLDSVNNASSQMMIIINFSFSAKCFKCSKHLWFVLIKLILVYYLNWEKSKTLNNHYHC